MIVQLTTVTQHITGFDRTAKKMASNLDFAEDIEEAKAYMAKKNVFQLFEVRNYFHSACL